MLRLQMKIIHCLIKSIKGNNSLYSRKFSPFKHKTLLKQISREQQGKTLENVSCLITVTYRYSGEIHSKFLSNIYSIEVMI